MTVKAVFFKKHIARSKAGDITMILCLVFLGVIMMLPMVLAISTSMKPSSEMWVFPPRFFARNPTLRNYTDLFALMSSSWAPFSRYIINTLFITGAGTTGHILLASMCAYPLAMYRFPGSKAFFTLVRTSLMFSGAVVSIPAFLIISRLRLLDTSMSLIIPAFGSSLGLFLMKQFMEQSVPHTVLESAVMDGAGELCIFFRMVMPMVKPAWLTLMIFSVQSLWGIGNTPYIFSEQKKTLPYAMSQIQAGGIARAGVGAAVAVLMMLVPLSIFIISQSNIIETMSTSGIKE